MNILAWSPETGQVEMEMEDRMGRLFVDGEAVRYRTELDEDMGWLLKTVSSKEISVDTAQLEKVLDYHSLSLYFRGLYW
jgi:hypothetical protein